MLNHLRTEDPPPAADRPQSTVSLARPSRLAYLLLLAAGLLTAALIVYPSRATSGSSPAVGQPAPPLSLVPMQIAGISITASTRLSSIPTAGSLRGRVSLLHFWGTWCGPCRHELPQLAALHKRLSSNHEFQFFSISCASFDDPSLATLAQRTGRFYRSSQIDLPTYADPSMELRQQLLCLMQRDCMAYPLTVLVDRQRTIRATWVGIPPGGVDTIAARTEALLATPCPAPH